MNSLWKPAVLAAYCNAGRSGSSLVDSGPRGLNAGLTKPGAWSQIEGHNNRWAIDLDGEQYGSVPSVGFGYTADLTVTAWIARGAVSGGTGVCGHRPGLGGFFIQVSLLAVSVTTYAVGSTNRNHSGANVGEWHHVAVRFSASSTEIFWDGASVGSSANGLIPLASAGSQIRLWALEGSGSVPTNPFLGRGADLCLWPTRLSNDEIAWLANPQNNILQLPSARRGFPMSRVVN